MEIVDLIKKCKGVLDNCSKELNPNPDVTILIKGKWGNRPYRSLFGVKGEIVTDTVKEGYLLCAFPARELLNAAVKQLPKLNYPKK